MKHFLCLPGLLVACCPGAALAQISASKTAAPVAYVYVSQQKQIQGFAVAPDGRLTSVPNSPIKGEVGPMAINGDYLFASSADQNYLYSYAVAADGALKLVERKNVQQYNPTGCGGLGPPLLDHTGQFLYAGVSSGDLGGEEDCADSTWQSYGIDEKTGALTYLGSNGDIFLFYGLLSTSGNDRFAYGADCEYAGGGGDVYLGKIIGFKRLKNGDLDYTIDGPTPTAQGASDLYCAEASASDPTNHLAVVLQAINDQTNNFDGPPQIATYSEDEQGNLTTKSTYENMPASGIGFAQQMKMAPSGKLVAIAGQGFQIFRFHGSEPVSSYSKVLQPGILFTQLAWDRSDHLYALGGGKLFVYTVTPESMQQTPGSPYAVKNGSGLTLRWLTPKPQPPWIF